jgi:hypothetical protein
LVARSHSESDAEFLNSLLAQREKYGQEKSNLLGELHRIQGELAKIEAAAKAVDELLRIEAPEIAKRDETAARNGVAEFAQYFDPDRPFIKAAYDILRDVGSPVYYRELADRIRASGIIIPGKDPASNLYAHLRRHPRFQRPTPGHFALSDQATAPIPATIPPATPSRRRKRRSRKRTSAKSYK